MEKEKLVKIEQYCCSLLGRLLMLSGSILLLESRSLKVVIYSCPNTERFFFQLSSLMHKKERETPSFKHSSKADGIDHWKIPLWKKNLIEHPIITNFSNAMRRKNSQPSNLPGFFCCWYNFMNSRQRPSNVKTGAKNANFEQFIFDVHFLWIDFFSPNVYLSENT